MHPIRKHGRGGDICTFLQYSLVFKLHQDISVNDESIEALFVKIVYRKSRNNLVNTQYRQPACQIKQYEKYLKNIFQKR